MRWSIIRLIWLRELRDQLRDRRTLFMIVVLPLLLYPVLGAAVLQFAVGFTERVSVIGVSASDGAFEFPRRQPAWAGRSQLPWLAWLSTATPTSASWIGAAALMQAGQRQWDYPGFLEGGSLADGDATAFMQEAHALATRAKLRFTWCTDADDLAQRRIDVLLRADDDFFTRLDQGEANSVWPRAGVQVETRPDDDYSKQAMERLRPMLEQWKQELRQVRLARRGLDRQFIEPFEVREPSAAQRRPASIVNLVVRIFPFMLVMWSLAGALYPAVDVCAGEKERGTMETLLITPAGREEIVVGKFLTIWVFSAASALLNLVSMGMTTWQFSARLPFGSIPIGSLAWCVMLSLPLSAFFSAVSLAIGAYARSSKEGQYYLMPLFLVTMPLVFLTLAPGVELNPFYSLVPVTGVALLMQRLMTATDLHQVPWLYFVPVVAPIALYSWLALRWAIDQFQREEVLFREAERIDVRLWLRHLLRDKEATPTPGQAFFCFGMILAMRWLATGLGQRLSAPAFTSVNLLAFVAAPVLIMTLFLNTRPRDSLAIRMPTWRELALAALLAVLLMPPLAAAAVTVFSLNPSLTQLLEDRQPLMQSLRTLIDGQEVSMMPYLVAFALVPAVCEELAFRGFILTGLLKRFRPRTAVLFNSFLFAIFHMNVFQFLPTFFLGVVLGLLTVRSRSLVPAMFFHLCYNSVLILSVPIRGFLEPQLLATWGPYVSALSFAVALAILWWLYRKPYVELERLRRNA